MQRLTHERSNGIKTGYWSPEKKEDLVARLAEYENTGLAPDEIESLKKYQWIPVEKPPEERKNYLCTVECAGCRHRIIGHYNKPGWTDDYAGQKVIAWMPLPESYKGADND